MVESVDTPDLENWASFEKSYECNSSNSGKPVKWQSRAKHRKMKV